MEKRENVWVYDHGNDFYSFGDVEIHESYIVILIKKEGCYEESFKEDDANECNKPYYAIIEEDNIFKISDVVNSSIEALSANIDITLKRKVAIDKANDDALKAKAINALSELRRERSCRLGEVIKEAGYDEYDVKSALNFLGYINKNNVIRDIIDYHGFYTKTDDRDNAPEVFVPFSRLIMVKDYSCAGENYISFVIEGGIEYKRKRTEDTSITYEALDVLLKKGVKL